MGGAAKRQRIVVAAAMFLAILAISVLCWGCAPTASSEQPSSGGGTPQEAVPAADAGGYPDFLEASAGIFPTRTSTARCSTPEAAGATPAIATCSMS